MSTPTGTLPDPFFEQGHPATVAFSPPGLALLVHSNGNSFKLVDLYFFHHHPPHTPSLPMPHRYHCTRLHENRHSSIPSPTLLPLRPSGREATLFIHGLPICIYPSSQHLFSLPLPWCHLYTGLLHSFKTVIQAQGHVSFGPRHIRNSSYSGRPQVGGSYTEVRTGVVEMKVPREK